MRRLVFTMVSLLLIFWLVACAPAPAAEAPQAEAPATEAPAAEVVAEAETHVEEAPADAPAEGDQEG